MSDLLHELCSSRIDFHPTFEGVVGWGERIIQHTANRLGDIVEIMKGRNVSETQRTRKEQREKKASEKVLRDFVMTCPATLRRSGYAVSATNRKA